MIHLGADGGVLVVRKGDSGDVDVRRVAHLRGQWGLLPVASALAMHWHEPEARFCPLRELSGSLTLQSASLRGSLSGVLVQPGPGEDPAAQGRPRLLRRSFEVEIEADAVPEAAASGRSEDVAHELWRIQATTRCDGRTLPTAIELDATRLGQARRAHGRAVVDPHVAAALQPALAYGAAPAPPDALVPAQRAAPREPGAVRARSGEAPVGVVTLEFDAVFVEVASAS